MAGSSKRGLNASKTRSSGMKKAASSKRAHPTTAKGKPGLRLPEEKSVRATKKTVGLKPLKSSREARKPVDPRTIDRRKQVFDDANAGVSSRR